MLEEDFETKTMQICDSDIRLHRPISQNTAQKLLPSKHYEELLAVLTEKDDIVARILIQLPRGAVSIYAVGILHEGDKDPHKSYDVINCGSHTLVEPGLPEIKEELTNLPLQQSTTKWYDGQYHNPPKRKR